MVDDRTKWPAGSDLRLRGWEWALLLLGLAAFATQALYSSPQKSAAFDEQYHLTRGVAYLKTGDFRLSRTHPPLINVLSALPLLGRSDITLPLDHPSWEQGDRFVFSDVFMWQAGRDPQSLLVPARLPIILLGTLLAAVLFVWARQWAGPAAGWAALILAVFDPNLLSNARLVTTDMGLTFFYAVAVWRLWRWLEHSTHLNFVLAGVAGGLATSGKYTGLLLWPTFLLILLLQDGRSHPRRSVARWLGLGLVGYAVVWAVYGFDVGPIPGLGLSLPIPAPHFPSAVLDTLLEIESTPRTAYLLGQTSPRGWWYYFPVALAVKTPLPLLLLSAGGLALVGRRRAWRKTLPLWLPPALLLLVSMSGRLTIGYRHILPVVPFLIVLAATAAATLWRSRPRQGAHYAVAILLLWQAADVVRLLPHQEAYFNQLAGGPDNGHRVLVDSNLDWGQDLIALRRLLQERDISTVNLAYFGTALPEAYGLNYKPLPGFLRFVSGPEIEAFNPYTPPPGWYAISLSSLQLGLFHQNLDLYSYFREQEPVARAGYSINLYHVAYPPDAPVERTVVTETSVADVPADELGLQPGRRLIVKWTASPRTTITPAPAELPPPRYVLEANFAGAFRLLGYDVNTQTVSPGEQLGLTLHWQVESGDVPRPSPATAPPLAAFVHLSGQDPSHIVAQYDGWDAALSGLERGDRITQQVTLQVPAEAQPGDYYLRAGLYSPQSGKRLALQDQAGDFVTLGPVSIE